MSREENKSKFGGRLGYILNDSTALPRVTFSNGLIRLSTYVELNDISYGQFQTILQLDLISGRSLQLSFIP